MRGGFVAVSCRTVKMSWCLGHVTGHGHGHRHRHGHGHGHGCLVLSICFISESWSHTTQLKNIACREAMISRSSRHVYFITNMYGEKKSNTGWSNPYDFSTNHVFKVRCVEKLSKNTESDVFRIAVHVDVWWHSCLECSSWGHLCFQMSSDIYNTSRSHT